MKKMFSLSLLCLMACMGTALNGASANEIAFGEKWSARLSEGVAENNLGPVFTNFLHTLLQKRNPNNLTQDVSARLKLPGTVMDLAHQLSTANEISDEEFTAISEAAAFLRWLDEYDNTDLGIALSQTNKEKADALWANLETASRAALTRAGSPLPPRVTPAPAAALDRDGDGTISAAEVAFPADITKLEVIDVRRALKDILSGKLLDDATVGYLENVIKNSKDKKQVSAAKQAVRYNQRAKARK